MRHRVLFGVGSIVLIACAVGHNADDSSTTPDGGGSDGSVTPNDASPKPDASNSDGGTTCTSPSTMCADAGCVDTTTSTNHCGSCTNACKTADAGSLVQNSDDNPDAGIPNFTIDAGVPWSLGTPSCTKSACGIDCPQGLTLCTDDICYDTQNFHEHCGDCNTTCAAGEYCAGGHCCAAGSEYCNGACTDVLSNGANCGACGKTCTSQQSCSNGTCVNCTNSNYATSATASSSGGGTTTYGPQNANDGKLETNQCSPYSWLNTSGGSTTEWIQYTWTSSHTITKVHMDTSASVNDSCSLGSYVVTGAQIQWWNGSSWITDGTVSGQTNDWDYTFTSPVTTTQIRLYSVRSQSGYNAFIFEWQAFGCN